MNSRPRSLNILNLLAHLLELRLGVDDQLRDAQAVGFRADGIHLAVHFLQKKIELAAAGLRPVAERLPMQEMSAKARYLFADVRALNGTHELLRDHRLVNGQLETDFPHPILEPSLESRPSLVGGA